MTPSSRSFAFVAFAALAAAAPAQLKGVQVASGLSQPDGLHVTQSDPSAFYVTQKTGQLQVVRNGVVASTAVDLSGIVDTAGERGLLGLAFDPNYATNGQTYLSYVQKNDSTHALHVARLTNFDLSTAQTIIDLPHADFNNHYGGNLQFGPEGDLYIGIGDGGNGNDPNGNAQNKNVLLGKLLRLDVSGGGAGYTIPSDNPFVGQAGVRGEIWAYGLRNPFKYSFDGNDLTIADVGQDSYEEIDRSVGNLGGRNYGWRTREGFHQNPAYPNDTPPANAVDPIYEYAHNGQGRSITGGFVYRGSALGSHYVGRYFFGDFVSKQLWSIDPNAANVAGSLEEYTAGLGFSAGITDISPDANGEVVVTDFYSGKAYRLEAVPEPATFAVLGLGALALVRKRRR